MSLAEEIGPHLPSLRRYARALSGSQASGDTYVRVMLETLVTNPNQWEQAGNARFSSFKLFHAVWNAVGQDVPTAAPDHSGRFTIADERLSSLAAPSRQALLLTAMEGFSDTEAAKIMGLSEADFRTLIKDADDAIKALTRSDVMIIEDEAIIALDIQGLVEELGHNVTGVAATRTEAQKLVAQKKPDILLADIQLADGSSGIDAASDILAELDIPVVFITAFPERLLTGRQVEPTFLITKPFQPAAVRAAISQALFFKQSARRLTAPAA
ncbi:response regulator [Pyruvatibacter mobilis]|uniref:response regulator n=1 Tax=Pyruvatibacter mobilis TaxID=1712261 RepID=UPI003BAAA25E